MRAVAQQAGLPVCQVLKVHQELPDGLLQEGVLPGHQAVPGQEKHQHVQRVVPQLHVIV